ncbi:hypothetical protein [Pseudomonas oryzihabitans]|uniref:hypothetical protein n=1 Tax=Pseudomonas oryzihabitans TaxID=47885 RepID=UPI0011154922|nr:hypothetical protein [Pseudomonas psychrotolerans]
MKHTDDFFYHENFLLLKEALDFSKKLEISFKNRTALATFCAHVMSSAKPTKANVSVSTLTRNPVYRAMLDERLMSGTKNFDLEILGLKLEVSRLRKENLRKDLYIQNLDQPVIDSQTSDQKQKISEIDFSKSYLVKTIDLLLACFSDHVELDSVSGDLIRPYLTSSDRIVVPSKIFKYYIRASSPAEWAEDNK